MFSDLSFWVTWRLLLLYCRVSWTLHGLYSIENGRIYVSSANRILRTSHDVNNIHKWHPALFISRKGLHAEEQGSAFPVGPKHPEAVSTIIIMMLCHAVA